MEIFPCNIKPWGKDMLMTEKMGLGDVMSEVPSLVAELEDEINAFDLHEGVRWCLHCEDWFDVKDMKVQLVLYERPKGKIAEKYLCCPNGKCSGSPIDWFTEEEAKINGIEYPSDKNKCNSKKVRSRSKRG